MSEIVHIPFHGGEILAIEEGGKPSIILKPAIEHIGLDFSTQLQKLKTRSWARVGQTPTRDSAGRVQEMVSVDLRTFLMLLATVDERRVSDIARPTLIAYQNEVADVIEAWFTRGRAFSRSTEDMGLTTLSFDEATALVHQEYGEDIPVAFFTRILRAAGILRQAGCIPHKSERRFFFFTGTSWEIRAWALPHLMRVFRETVREFQRYPFEQLRLDLTSADRAAIGSDA